jgi:ABC transport system ATP-binding/permease protein
MNFPSPAIGFWSVGVTIHAEIRRIGDDRFEVIDKGSANGLRINGHELSRALLDGRDVIEIGDVVLKYIAQGQVFRATADEGIRIAAFAGSGPPPVDSARKTAAGRVVAALIGALLVAGALMLAVESRKVEDTHSTTGELVALDALIRSGDLVGAAQKINALGPLERSMTAFETLHRGWAEAILAAPDGQFEEAERRRLLNQIVQTHSLPPALRDAAQSELAATTKGAVDLSDLSSLENPAEK